MGIIELSMVTSAIVSLGIKGVIDNTRRQEAIIKVLSKFGLQPGISPKNFDEIYIFTLVEFGIDQPKAVLDFFRNDFIKKAFMHSLEKEDFSILENEAKTFVEWNKIGEDFQKMDIDISIVFTRFKSIFLDFVSKSRTPHEIQQDQKLNEILKAIREGKDIKKDSLWSQEISDLPENEERFCKSCLIPSLPDYYVERKDLLIKAKDVLGIGKNEYSKAILALIGIGGIGKTVLAVAITNESDIKQLFPNGYLWASLGSDKRNEESINPILDDWLKSEGIDPNHLQNTEAKIASLSRAFRNIRKLLIIDDVWDAEPARALISSAGSECSIIITTRDRELPSRLGISKIIEVGNLGEREAKNLIENRLGESITEEYWNESLQPFLKLIGFHTLAISLAAGQIVIGDRNWKDLQVEFTNKQKENPIDFLNPKLREESVNFSLDLTTNLLDVETLEKFAWLGILAMGEDFYLEEAAMLWSYFSIPQEEIYDKSKWMTSEREKANDLIKRLYRIGLIDIQQKSDHAILYSIHPLIQDYALRLLVRKFNLQAALYHHAWFNLSLLYNSAPFESITISAVIEKQVKAILERAWDTYIENENALKFADREAAISLILLLTHKVSEFWEQIGNTYDLIEWGQKALLLGEEKTDKDSEQDFLLLLSRAYKKIGDYDTALKLAKKSLKIFEDNKPQSSNELKAKRAIVYMQIINILIEKEQYDQAIYYLDKTLNIAKSLKDVNLEGKVLGNFGSVYFAQQLYDKAITYFEKSIQIFETIPNFLSLGQQTGNMGAAYLQKSDVSLNLALNCLWKSIRTAREVNNKTSEANHLTNIGLIYYHLFRKDLAELCTTRAIEIYNEIKSPKIELAKKNLAMIQGSYINYEIPLSIDTMFELTVDVCRGDKVASAVLLPNIQNLVNNSSELSSEKVNIAIALQEIINGERDPKKIIKKFSPIISANLLLILISIEDPSKYQIIILFQTILTRISRKEQNATETGNNFIDFLRNRKVLEDDEIKYLAEIISLMSNGVTDLKEMYLTTKDKKVSEFANLLFYKLVTH